MIGLNNYQNYLDTFEEVFGSSIVDFKTNDTISTSKIYPGFNDGVFPLFFWARGVLCEDLNMSYGFRDIYSGDSAGKVPPAIKFGQMDCYPNKFWGSSVFSLPFNI